MEDLRLIIAQLKIKFGRVFLTEVEDDIYIFRLLTRREYKEVLIVSESKDMTEELVCQMAVVYPADLNFATGDAGLPSLLAPEIINESGFGDMQRSHFYFDLYRKSMGQFEMQAEAVIQTAFPTVTEDEMQDWTAEHFMKMLAKAEWILREIKGYPFEFQEFTPEEGEREEVPKSMKEIGDELRQRGLDPMAELYDVIKKEKPFAEFPFIAGTSYWKQVY